MRSPEKVHQPFNSSAVKPCTLLGYVCQRKCINPSTTGRQNHAQFSGIFATENASTLVNNSAVEPCVVYLGMFATHKNASTLPKQYCTKKKKKNAPPVRPAKTKRSSQLRVCFPRTKHEHHCRSAVKHSHIVARRQPVPELCQFPDKAAR